MYNTNIYFYINSMNNEIKPVNITVITNNGTEVNSIYVSDDDTIHKFIAVPFSPNGEYGWFKMLHNAILDTRFVLPKVITKDCHKIIDKHMVLKNTDSYNKEAYIDELFNEVVSEIGSSDVIDNEISKMIGSCEPIIYNDIRHVIGNSNYIVGYNSFNEFANRLCIDGITYFIHTMSNKTDSYAMCIYYPENESITVTLDPLEFLNEMESGLYLFGGEINIKESYHKQFDILTDDIIKIIDFFVKKRINNYIKKLECSL